jgi:transposase-like protein
MKITCPQCNKYYCISENHIPDQKVSFKCSCCEKKIVIDPGPEAQNGRNNDRNLL